MSKDDKYIVIELSTTYPLAPRWTFSFDQVQDVVSHMWGRDCGKYLIYKNGILAHLSHLYGDIKKLEEYLDGI
jgi:hypothetical protein